jgi:hypothetical protein
LQTETPHWLEIAYESPITRSDIGLVQRNLDLARSTQLLINWCFDRRARFLDYAGGYGLLVRLLRDRGFDFHLYEPFTDNLFAQGFQIEDAPFENDRFEVVTAFEVLEHLEHPVQHIENMLSVSDAIFATTTLYPEDSNPLKAEWDYLAPETGQHIAFFSSRTFRYIADRYGLQYNSYGGVFHLLTKRRINPLLFAGICSYRTRGLLGFKNWFGDSLIESDLDRVKNDG